MRIPRVYYQGSLEVGKAYALSTAASHHLVKVLRLTESHPLVLFNNDGFNYFAEIIKAGKTVEVKITEATKNLSESPIKIHLGQVISKGDKMDYTVQKAVELGITEITPLFSEFCDVKLNPERKQKKWQHWQGIVVNACQQCGRSIVPDFYEPMKLVKWIETVNADIKIILHPRDSVALSELKTDAVNNIAILIGSEGGLSDTELQLAKDNGFIAIQLGPRILRTETASVAALTILQQLFGDFR